MQIRRIWQTVALAGVLAIAVRLASARPQDQIVLVHDSQGRAVYVNAAEAARPVSNTFGPISPVEIAHPAVHKLISQTAHSFDVDPRLVEAVVKVESGYDAQARSPKGALGLMQLMPGTAARFGVANPLDASENVRGGVAYLGHLLRQFNGDVPLSLAAYNAGEGSVMRYGGIPQFRETQDYVRKVTALYPESAAWRNGGVPRPIRSDPANRGALTADNAPTAFPIDRYMDTQGVIHFSQ